MQDVLYKLKHSSFVAFIYILKSHKDNGIYIGSTRNLYNGFNQHLKGKVKSTKSRKPLVLIYFEEFENYSDAFKRERYLKTGTGRDWIKQNVLSNL